MKHIDVATLFPRLLAPFLEEGLLGRAVQRGLLDVTVCDLRPYGLGRHQAVDDVPYGGGAGMVIRPEPVFSLVRERFAAHRAAGRPMRTVLLTPQGRPFDQATAARWAAGPEGLLLLCGRYEGFDERIRLALADEAVSAGDYVCLGGEAPALAMLEAVGRLLPGVLGNPASPTDESFAAGCLEYPQYTRPADFEGMRVPEVLLSGDHARIEAWRREQALRRTRRHRPDLLEQGERGEHRSGPRTDGGWT